MLITFLKMAYPDFEENLPKLSEIDHFYKEAKLLFDRDESFKQSSYDNVVKL
jgi:hypothetical protein